MPKDASRRRTRRPADDRGNTLVEAALVTPLLILLTLAIVDFASLFYAYLSLENGVSQATRFAVTGNQLPDPNNPGGQLSRTASIMAAMRAATPTLTLDDSAFTFSHMPPGGYGWIAGDGGPGDLERVRVDYTWPLLTPVIRPFFQGGEIHVTVSSAMKNEGRFQ